MSDFSITVVDSYFTVSGRILVALQSLPERPYIEMLLSCAEGRKWKVVNNSVKVGGKPNQDMLDAKEKENIFFCELEVVGHSSRPENGLKLEVV